MPYGNNEEHVYVIIETFSEYTNSDPGGLMQAGGLTYKQNKFRRNNY